MCGVLDRVRVRKQLLIQYVLNIAIQQVFIEYLVCTRHWAHNTRQSLCTRKVCVKGEEVPTQVIHIPHGECSLRKCRNVWEHRKGIWMRPLREGLPDEGTAHVMSRWNQVRSERSTFLADWTKCTGVRSWEAQEWQVGEEGLAAERLVTWPGSPGGASFAAEVCRYSQGWQRNFGGIPWSCWGLESPPQQQGGEEVSGLGQSSWGVPGATVAGDGGWPRQAGTLLASPHLFLHFCSQQQANLIPGLNLSALGIFSTGLSVLPPPAGPRGPPPAPPYHPFAVSSSASEGC